MPLHLVGLEGILKAYRTTNEKALYELMAEVGSFRATAAFYEREKELLLFSHFFIPFLGDETIPLFFDNNDKEHSNFLFPRLKRLDEEYFILSGLFKKDGEMYQLIGKFEGQIPANYIQYQDELKYPEDYWK